MGYGWVNPTPPPAALDGAKTPPPPPLPPPPMPMLPPVVSIAVATPLSTLPPPSIEDASEVALADRCRETEEPARACAEASEGEERGWEDPDAAAVEAAPPL